MIASLQRGEPFLWKHFTPCTEDALGLFLKAAKVNRGQQQATATLWKQFCQGRVAVVLKSGKTSSHARTPVKTKVADLKKHFSFGLGFIAVYHTLVFVSFGHTRDVPVFPVESVFLEGGRGSNICRITSASK